MIEQEFRFSASMFIESEYPIDADKAKKLIMGQLSLACPLLADAQFHIRNCIEIENPKTPKGSNETR